MFKVGDRVMMTEEALDNYGDEYRDVPLTIASVATHYMPAKKFFAQGMPSGFHPGYEEAAGGRPLYDLEEIEFSLYYWELEEATHE
jgi:hypothetical protein